MMLVVLGAWSDTWVPCCEGASFFDSTLPELVHSELAAVVRDTW